MKLLITVLLGSGMGCVKTPASPPGGVPAVGYESPAAVDLDWATRLALAYPDYVLLVSASSAKSFADLATTPLESRGTPCATVMASADPEMAGRLRQFETCWKVPTSEGLKTTSNRITRHITRDFVVDVFEANGQLAVCVEGRILFCAEIKCGRQGWIHRFVATSPVENVQ